MISRIRKYEYNGIILKLSFNLISFLLSFFKLQSNIYDYEIIGKLKFIVEMMLSLKQRYIYELEDI